MREDCQYLGDHVGNLESRGTVVDGYQCKCPIADYHGCAKTDFERDVMAERQSKMLSCESCDLYLDPSLPPPPPPEPVGDVLKAILDDAGCEEPPGCQCEQWRARMNHWGIAGCQKNRQKIIAYLKETSEKASAACWRSLALKLYTSSASLLDEAIKRAASLPQG